MKTKYPCKNHPDKIAFVKTNEGEDLCLECYRKVVKEREEDERSIRECQKEVYESSRGDFVG